MKTRILLVNFNESDKKTLTELGIDVDLGYLSDATSISSYSGPSEQVAYFYSPYAIYDYKAVFIKLTKTPPLEAQLKVKAQPISKEDKLTFYKYWMNKKGITIIFTEDSSYAELTLLGIPFITLSDSRGNDNTVSYALKTDKRFLRKVLEEIEGNIAIPPKKYIVSDHYEYNRDQTSWVIYPIYENRNEDNFGIYLNWGHTYSDRDLPAFLVLPQYNDYAGVIKKCLMSFSRIFPTYFLELHNLDWEHDDQYYPKAVKQIDDEINDIVSETERKVQSLKDQKLEIKAHFSFLHSLLTEFGEPLKIAVLKTLNDVFNINAVDADLPRKNQLKEDILIQDVLESPILAEVKGTTNSYPTFAYVTQVLSNLLKQKNTYENAIGCLILNMDRECAPNERSYAYTNPEESSQLEEIIFIDTRVLFDVAIAVIDLNMPIAEAKEMLFKKGRVAFDIEDYKKNNNFK